MRRVLASVLFTGLCSSAAFAEDAAPPPAPAPAPAPAARKTSLRVVRVLPETQQALLFDKTKGTHVLVDIGKTIDGFKVDDIDEDTVTLTPIDGGAQIVLAGPDPSWRRHAAPTKPAAQPEDPYASSAAPVDPYAEEVRTAEAPGAAPAPSTAAAPIAAGDGGVRTAEAPNATPAPVRAAQAPTNTPVRTAQAPATDAADAAMQLNAAGVRTVAAPDASPPVTPIADGPTVIAKAEIHAALSNFGALAGSMRGAFTPTGARLDAVAPDSLLAKAGLRAGDVITSINNQPLRSIDDAANLYARAGSMTTATIQIQRAGKPMSLRLAFQ